MKGEKKMNINKKELTDMRLLDFLNSQKVSYHASHTFRDILFESK